LKPFLKGIAVCTVFGMVLSLGVAPSGSTQTAAPQVKVIEMTAKKYAYTPSEIRVKKGTRVQLKIRALDRTHGFKIALFPEGAGESGGAGLKFDPPQEKFKLAEKEESVIEFVAERAGNYPFKCSVFCGLGHSGMKGMLIVEE